MEINKPYTSLLSEYKGCVVPSVCGLSMMFDDRFQLITCSNSEKKMKLSETREQYLFQIISLN